MDASPVEEAPTEETTIERSQIEKVRKKEEVFKNLELRIENLELPLLENG